MQLDQPISQLSSLNENKAKANSIMHTVKSSFKKQHQVIKQ